MHSLNRSVFLGLCLGVLCSGLAWAADRVKTANGVIESTTQTASGVRIFKGIPFAQPPVGDLRWREPQPVKNWKGVRKAGPVRPALHAAHRPRLRLLVPQQRHERGLPVPERVDAGQIGP